MSSSLPSKIQQRTLSNLRTILRHIRLEFDAANPTSFQTLSPLAATAAATSTSSVTNHTKFRQTPLFSTYVLSQYRENQRIKDKTKARELRDHAADLVSYLEALKAQENILRLSRGVDPDRPMQRQAVARMVGFEMPKVTNEAMNASTAARSPEEVAGPYLSNVKERISTGEAANRLTGIENLKAQYFGVTIPESIQKIDAKVEIEDGEKK